MQNSKDVYTLIEEVKEFDNMESEVERSVEGVDVHHRVASLPSLF